MRSGTIVGLYDVCNYRAAFDYGSAFCCDEDGRLSELLNIEEFWRGAVLFVSFVEDEVVFDVELFQKPDHALGLRILRGVLVAAIGRGGVEQTLRWWRLGSPAFGTSASLAAMLIDTRKDEFN